MTDLYHIGYSKNMLKKFGIIVPESMALDFSERFLKSQSEREEMSEYTEPIADASDNDYTVAGNRKNIMKGIEYSSRRLERLAVEKVQLENRRREVIFLMEAEQAVVDGLNQALSKMDGFDQTGEELPSDPYNNEQAIVDEFKQKRREMRGGF